MKTKFIFLALAATVSLASCSKLKDEINGGSTTATVNGGSFKAKFTSGDYSGATFSMVSNDKSGREISFTITPASDSVTSYAIDTVSHEAWYFAEETAPGSRALNGTITLHLDSKHATGTFNFVCEDGTKVENGSFDASL